MNYFIEYNNVRNDEIELQITKRPNVPAPIKNIKEIIIPGRNGSLHVSDNTYQDIIIEIEFGFKSTDYMNTWRKAKEWLRNSGTLILSDDDNYFLKVGNVVISDSQREIKRTGKFKAAFSCNPFFYSNLGQQKLMNPTKLYNDGFMSQPIYYIEGEGMCTLTVNGKTITANVGQNVTIDTENMLAYRTDGTIVNTSIDGDYEDMIFEEGENTISITDEFTLYVAPNWRYL